MRMKITPRNVLRKGCLLGCGLAENKRTLHMYLLLSSLKFTSHKLSSSTSSNSLQSARHPRGLTPTADSRISVRMDSGARACTDATAEHDDINLQSWHNAVQQTLISDSFHGLPAACRFSLKQILTHLRSTSIRFAARLLKHAHTPAARVVLNRLSERASKREVQ